jgi:hypothetical protein
VDGIFILNVSEQLRNAAIEELEATGCRYWETNVLLKGPLNSDDISDPELLRQEMLQKLASLEEAMAQLSALTTQIGHNNPPDPIEPVQFGNDEYTAVANAISTLKSVGPQTSVDKVIDAARRLKALGDNLKSYATKQADNFVSEAVKAAGSETGKWVVRLPLIMIIADQLIAVFRATVNWLASLGISF